MTKSFSLKTIRITVQLRKGTFTDGGNTRVMEGLACEVYINKPGLPEQNTASVKIWGLTYDAMAQMTMLSFRPLETFWNTIIIEAGELGKQLSTIFRGNITRASADFNQIPDPVMQIEAASGYFAQQLPTPATSVNGEAKAEDLFKQWSTDSGMVFKNDGVTASVKDAYFPGDPINKMKKLSHDIDCELIIDDDEAIITPAGTPRAGAPILISVDAGMIGSPTFNQTGISCKCIFNPAIRYGNLIDVQSIVPRATGQWFVIKLSHNLSANTPSAGPWETQIEGAPLGVLYG